MHHVSRPLTEICLIPQLNAHCQERLLRMVCAPVEAAIHPGLHTPVEWLDRWPYHVAPPIHAPAAPSLPIRHSWSRWYVHHTSMDPSRMRYEERYEVARRAAERALRAGGRLCGDALIHTELSYAAECTAAGVR